MLFHDFDTCLRLSPDIMFLFAGSIRVVYICVIESSFLGALFWI
jgi:hypothetical protein